MKKQTEITKKDALKLIDSTYWSFKRATQSKHYADKYEGHIRQDENDHRRYRPDGINCGLSKTQAVKLFFVEYVINAKNPDVKAPDAKDFCWTKSTVFEGYSLYHEHKEEFDKIITPELLEAWKKIDYAKLMEA